jgi:hypothetical protein
MSLVLLLLLVGALYARDYFRRKGEALAVVQRIPRTAGGAEFGRLPLQAALERRHGERRHADRRHAA